MYATSTYFYYSVRLKFNMRFDVYEIYSAFA